MPALLHYRTATLLPWLAQRVGRPRGTPPAIEPTPTPTVPRARRASRRRHDDDDDDDDDDGDDDDNRRRDAPPCDAAEARMGTDLTSLPTEM